MDLVTESVISLLHRCCTLLLRHQAPVAVVFLMVVFVRANAGRQQQQSQCMKWSKRAKVLTFRPEEKSNGTEALGQKVLSS